MVTDLKKPTAAGGAWIQLAKGPGMWDTWVDDPIVDNIYDNDMDAQLQQCAPWGEATIPAEITEWSSMPREIQARHLRRDYGPIFQYYLGLPPK